MNHPLRIAVADDELDMREFLEEALRNLGHDVIAVVTTGKELIDVCRADRPELVITDIRMPDMDGLDAVAEIYNEEPLPIIVVTAYHDPQLVQRAEERHVLAFLVKPIKEADL